VLFAYYTTFRVVLSYLRMLWRARYRSPSAMAEAWQRTHIQNARGCEKTIASLQGLFLKVGQLISIMTNCLPEEFRRQLEGLQDQVPPRPYADIEARVIEELGRRPTELFAEFAERPIASASIGQVHKARLHSGEEVAVKVQYPDIEEIVRIDLRALRRIFSLLRWVMPDYGFDTIYQEIRGMVLSELDYRLEAAAME